MNREIFISHSSHDKAVAEAVCEVLERRGLRCWIAPRDIVPGTDWSSAIVDGLLEGRVTVLVFSAHSQSSAQVRREVQFTFEQGRALVPLRIDDTVPEGAMAYYLGPVHWLNATTPPLEPHLESLVAVVGQMLGDDGATGRRGDRGDGATEATGRRGDGETGRTGLSPSNRPVSPSPGLPVALVPAGNLPASMTPFVGREAEVAAWQDLLCRPETRLLTLVGFGGTGKSRSALELAGRCAGREFPEGVWWVDLQEATTGEEMLQRVAEALSLEPAPQKPLREQVALRLNRRLLLVLDNTEQIEDAGSLVSALLKAAPQMTCLVTSRRALEIAAERAVEVLPLGPEEAETLFIERARARHAAFERTEANAADLTELCRRLEGLPLAIELAASRVVGMTPRDMLDRLTDRFRLLQTRAPDLPPRQRALTGAIEWSHELLHEDEKALFAQLSVFSRGFTLTAAEEVCDVFDVFESVHELRRHSLLRAETDAGTQQMRFFMLELVRDYAARKLTMEEFRQRHAEFFLHFAEVRAGKLRTDGEAEALAEMAVELDNLRAALAWSQQDPERSALCVRLTLAMHPVLYRRGLWTELRSCLETARTAADALPDPDAEGALLRRHMSSLAHDRGELDGARAEAEAALALYRARNETAGTADTLNLLGVIATDAGEAEAAQSLFEEALALRAAEDHAGRALSLHNLGRLSSRRGDREASRRLYEESLAERRLAGDRRGTAETLGNLGAVAYHLADFDGARRLYGESLALYRELGDRHGIALMLHNLGELAEKAGDRSRAVRRFVHAERIFRELQSAFAAASAEALGNLMTAMGADTFAAAHATAEQTPLEAIEALCTD